MELHVDATPPAITEAKVLVKGDPVVFQELEIPQGAVEQVRNENGIREILVYELRWDGFALRFDARTQKSHYFVLGRIDADVLAKIPHGGSILDWDHPSRIEWRRRAHELIRDAAGTKL